MLRKAGRLFAVVAMVAFIVDGGESLAQRKSRAAKKSRASAQATKRGKSTRSTKRGKSAAAKRGKSSRGRVAKRRSRRKRGGTLNASRAPATSIPQERVTEIQAALIRAGYLEGPPTAEYDEATTNAMKRFQGAHSLPRTGLPSAATLKILGVPKNSGDGYSAPIKSVEGHDPPRGGF